MATLVSLLRGVNVGGHKKLKMSQLAELYGSLGFTDVRTYVQSGNVVFSHDGGAAERVAKQIEKELKSRLNLDVTIFLRTPDELGDLAERNPFKKYEPNRVHITFLSTKPNEIPTNRIDAARARGELFSVQNREVFLFLPNGQGKTKLSNSFFEKVLNVRATTRNWNTVTALLKMANQPGAGSEHRSDEE
jgi:uncharacterized protein (DUF1697 family)